MSEKERKWYKIIFKQNQPIHLGSLKWRVLNETLLFIPGFTMWGTLTNAYLLENKPNSEEELKEIKKYFETITCFYPCFDENGERVLFPKFKDGKFYLGNYSEEELRFYFTDSLVRTAVEPINRGAKEEALYEIEFISPKPKKGFCEDVKNLYWVGVLEITEKFEDFLKEGLKIYVGGDIRYGLGELELVKKDPISEGELKKWNINENGELNINNEEVLVNFLEFNNNIEFEGKLLLVPELEFKENIPTIVDAKYFIVPGSKVMGNMKNDYKLNRGRFLLSR